MFWTKTILNLKICWKRTKFCKRLNQRMDDLLNCMYILCILVVLTRFDCLWLFVTYRLIQEENIIKMIDYITVTAPLQMKEYLDTHIWAVRYFAARFPRCCKCFKMILKEGYLLDCLPYCRVSHLWILIWLVTLRRLWECFSKG